MEKNVFGEKLHICCTSPMTGYFRDGSLFMGNSMSNNSNNDYTYDTGYFDRF